MKKISVLIITYNQESVIRRTLDSVLKHIDWGLYEIVISDDCSSDNTWSILLEYKKHYPSIVKPYRNATNLGIYGNAQELYYHRGNADLFLFLDGDDVICPGLFKEIQSFIVNNRVETDINMAIFFDWKSIMPNNKETIYRQNLVQKEKHPYSLAIRGHLNYRGAVFSSSVLDNYSPAVLDKGLNLAEAMWDFQGIRLTDYFYYLPFVGTAYYQMIGVSTSLKLDTPYYNEEDVIRWDYLSRNYAINRRDYHWMKACMYRTKCRMEFSFVTYAKMLFHYTQGIAPYDFKLRKLANFLLLRGYSLYL